MVLENQLGRSFVHQGNEAEGAIGCDQSISSFSWLKPQSQPCRFSLGCGAESPAAQDCLIEYQGVNINGNHGGHQHVPPPVRLIWLVLLVSRNSILAKSLTGAGELKIAPQRRAVLETMGVLAGHGAGCSGSEAARPGPGRPIR